MRGRRFEISLAYSIVISNETCDRNWATDSSQSSKVGHLGRLVDIKHRETSRNERNRREYASISYTRQRCYLPESCRYARGVSSSSTLPILEDRSNNACMAHIASSVKKKCKKSYLRERHYDISVSICDDDMGRVYSYLIYVFENSDKLSRISDSRILGDFVDRGRK